MRKAAKIIANRVTGRQCSLNHPFAPVTVDTGCESPSSAELAFSVAFLRILDFSVSIQFRTDEALRIYSFMARYNIK
ncbi:MAG: hypothetical protein PHF83_03695, partial [Candidatus Methanomethylophilus sp.]|nr:hypothetical protein [Methanomethylophilus sp.]